MTRRRHSSDEPRNGGFTVPTLWRLVRWVVRGLIVLQAAARALPAGRARRRFLHELGQGLGILETAVRCLLLMMRAPGYNLPGRKPEASSVEGTPFECPTRDPSVTLMLREAEAQVPEVDDLCAPRFSLHMKEIGRAAGQAFSGPHAGNVRRVCPETRLARRLAALRHALAHPEAEAARMAAYMMARGYRRRAPQPLRPWAGFGPGRLWACLRALAGTPLSPDTS